jgi:hypothetical protein
MHGLPPIVEHDGDALLALLGSEARATFDSQ